MNEAALQIVRFWRGQWDAYVKSMVLMQQQGDAMLEAMLKSGALQEGSKQSIAEWQERCKAAQMSYFEMMETQFKKLEELVAPKK